MDKFDVKNLIIGSSVLGLVFGLFANIPFLGILVLFALMLLTAPCVILFLIMIGKFDLSNIKDSIISGAITGFCANITYCGVFCIVTAILYFAFNYNPNLFLTSMITNSPLWLLIVCILFVGTFTATTNAFSGFLTYYIIDFIRDSYAKKHKNDTFTLYK